MDLVSEINDDDDDDKQQFCDFRLARLWLTTVIGYCADKTTGGYTILVCNQANTVWSHMAREFP